MRKIYFCKSWFRAKKKAIDIWTEENARIAHQSGAPYTVLVDSPDAPFCFIEVVNGTVVVVGFLDDYLRERLTYVFNEIEIGKLFLERATYVEFDGDSDNVKQGTSYIFNENGKVTIHHAQYSPNNLKTSESTFNPENYYEKSPLFGEYEHLIKVER